MKKDKAVAADKQRRSPEEADILDKLLKEYATDEMGLLDLVFIDEILSQKTEEKIRRPGN